MLTPPVADLVGTAHCAAIRSQSFAACDGELSSDERADVDAHLADCAACRYRFSADGVFRGVVRAAVARQTAPTSLHDRILLSLTIRTTVNAPA